MQNEGCQVGGLKVTGRQNFFFLREDERLRSYRVINKHPRLPWNFMTREFLDPSAFPEVGKRGGKNLKHGKELCLWVFLLSPEEGAAAKNLRAHFPLYS